MRRLLMSVFVVLGVVACNGSKEPVAPPVSSAIDLVAGPAVGVDTANPQTEAAVAFDGTSYLVVWTEVRSSGKDVLAARMSADGQILDAAPFAVSAAAGDQFDPAVAFDGTNYLVVWQDSRDGKHVYGARVAPAGAVLDANGILVSGSSGTQLKPTVGFDGATFVVAWEEQLAGGNDVYGARVSGLGEALGVFAISTAGGQQFQPSIACVPGGCLAAWRDQRAAGPDVYGARIVAGAVVDPNGFGISRAGSSQGKPSVSTDGTGYLVVWNDTRNGSSDVYGARVTTAGEVVDTNGIAISRAADLQQAPVAAFEGAYHVVTWEDRRSGSWAVYAARVDAAGAVLDADGFLVETGVQGASVAIASNGNGRALVAVDRLEVVDPLLPGTPRVRARFLTVRAPLSVAKIGNGTGTVTSTPAGIDCGAACSAMLDAPTEVSLVPVADAGSAFVAWSGDCAGGGACTVNVDDAKSVTAKFSPYHLLTVAKAGTGAGVVRSEPAGIDCGAACSAQFVEETLVRLVPEPVVGSAFAGWNGPCRDLVLQIYEPGRPVPCTVRIDEATAVTASFAPAYKMTVTASGTAQGTVTGNYGLSCSTGSTDGCSSWVIVNGVVTLTANPGPGAILKSWVGSCMGSAPTCSVTMNGTKNVTATFQPASYPLTVALSGVGAGTVTGGPIACTTGSSAGCSGTVDNTTPTTLVTLKAAPAPGSVFKGWIGICYGLGDCTVSMSLARSVTAKFEPATWPLAVTVNGTGSGTVAGGPIACTTGDPAGCTGVVSNTTPEQKVTLEATPASGNVFKGWSGGCFGLAPCVVTMNAAKSVTAVFEPATWPLSASITGTGSGAVTGAGLDCGGPTNVCSVAVPNTTPYGSVTLTATPDATSVFKRWTGCNSYSGASCTVSMSTAKSVVASFEPSTYALSSVILGSGSVTGAGVECASGTGTCSAPVANGAIAQLVATPDAGWIFKGWSGCSSFAGTACNVTMTAAKSITATFQPEAYALGVVTVGTGVGTVTGGGIACTSGSTDGCSAAVPNGATVTLTATPAEGSILKSWSGCMPAGNTCKVSMTAAKNVTVTFQPSHYTLAIVGSGGGAATVTGAGISCDTATGAGCSGISVPNGATLTVTATPDATSIFKYWSGCSASGTSCTVMMTSSKTLTLNVQPAFYTLTATQTGNGSISGSGITCLTGSTDGCSAPVANGATASVIATPDPGWIFKYWSGCNSTSGTTCNVVMTAAKTVRATFQPASYPVTINLSGLGKGTVEGAGVTCASGSSCLVQVDNGATISLTAIPDAGATLSYWSGCTSVVGSTCNVTATSARSVTASFAVAPAAP